MSSTKLRKLEKGFKLLVYKIVLHSSKNEIFQANEFVYCRRAKLRVNDNNVVGGKSEIQLRLEVLKGKKRVRRFDFDN